MNRQHTQRLKSKLCGSKSWERHLCVCVCVCVVSVMHSRNLPTCEGHLIWDPVDGQHSVGPLIARLDEELLRGRVPETPREETLQSFSSSLETCCLSSYRWNLWMMTFCFQTAKRARRHNAGSLHHSDCFMTQSLTPIICLISRGRTQPRLTSGQNHDKYTINIWIFLKALHSCWTQRRNQTFSAVTKLYGRLLTTLIISDVGIMTEWVKAEWKQE